MGATIGSLIQDAPRVHVASARPVSAQRPSAWAGNAGLPEGGGFGGVRGNPALMAASHERRCVSAPLAIANPAKSEDYGWPGEHNGSTTFLYRPWRRPTGDTAPSRRGRARKGRRPAL
jgi:hypothetical protein